MSTSAKNEVPSQRVWAHPQGQDESPGSYFLLKGAS